VNFVVVEHECHLIAATVDAAKPPSDGGDQLFDGREQRVGQDRPLKMPHSRSIKFKLGL
jgi:hypothetical protein